MKMFISKSVNHLDLLLLLSYYFTLALILCNLLATKVVMYKLNMIILFFIIGIFIFIIRIISLNKNSNYSKNVYDLGFLCDNCIDVSSDNIKLLEEKEVSYDLLKRENIINQLYNVIVKCNPSNTFTIGLQGSWGEGKTTIVNNVISLLEKNKIKKNYAIVKFDPWSYDNEKAMLKGLIDKILEVLNLNYKLKTWIHL